jgi:hypothetical protein
MLMLPYVQVEEKRKRLFWFCQLHLWHESIVEEHCRINGVKHPLHFEINTDRTY